MIRPGDEIKVQIDPGTATFQRALMGFDGEVGYLVPLGMSDQFEWRLFAGGYHYLEDGHYEAVSGPKGRAEFRMYDVPGLGSGSRFMAGVEGQYDEPRGQQIAALVSLRIPFDVFSEKQSTPLKGLDRRMLQPVVRTSEITTADYVEDLGDTIITDALNPAGLAYTSGIDTTLDDMGDAVENHQDEVIVIFVDGEGITSIDLDTDDRFVLPGNNQTVSIMGKELVVGYETEQYGSGTVGYTPAGTPFSVTRSVMDHTMSVINMNPGSHLNGLEVVGPDVGGGNLF